MILLKRGNKTLGYLICNAKIVFNLETQETRKYCLFPVKMVTKSLLSLIRQNQARPVCLVFFLLYTRVKVDLYPTKVSLEVCLFVVHLRQKGATDRVSMTSHPRYHKMPSYIWQGGRA